MDKIFDIEKGFRCSLTQPADAANSNKRKVKFNML